MRQEDKRHRDGEAGPEKLLAAAELAPEQPCQGERGEPHRQRHRSEEHTSELQSLMRISYAVFCLKKKINITKTDTHNYLTNKSYTYTTTTTRTNNKQQRQTNIT